MSGRQSPQENANLAQDAYRDYATSPGKKQFTSLDGVTYEILEHVNHNATNGYAGTIYQRVDTGEIIIAHRGSEDARRQSRSHRLAELAAALQTTAIELAFHDQRLGHSLPSVADRNPFHRAHCTAAVVAGADE